MKRKTINLGESMNDMEEQKFLALLRKNNKELLLEIVNNRYDEIFAYFERNPFGSEPLDRFSFNLLPPIDKIVILEYILTNQAHIAESRVDKFVNVVDKFDKFWIISACIDSLTIAYLEAEWNDLAVKFIQKCEAAGRPATFTKISSSDRISEFYNETLERLREYSERGEFYDILERFCLKWSCDPLVDPLVGYSPLTGETTEDIFSYESRCFINDLPDNF